MTINGAPAAPWHDFEDDLSWAEKQTDEPYWERVYRLWFPDFRSRTAVPDGVGQRIGRDTVVVLTNGDALHVQEKARRIEDTGDILLEFEHRYPSGFAKPGWMSHNSNFHYLAYVFVPSRAGYLFPFQPLRSAWLKNRASWLQLGERGEGGFRLCAARNRDYKTWSVAVPTLVLYRAVGAAHRVEWAP